MAHMGYTCYALMCVNQWTTLPCENDALNWKHMDLFYHLSLHFEQCILCKCVCVQQTCATGAWLPFDSSTPTDWSFDRFPSIISCFLDILGFSVILPSTSLSPTGVVVTWGCDLLKMVAAAAMLGWEPTRICGRTSKLPTLSLLCGMFHNIDLNQKTKHPYPFFSDSFDVNIDC